MKARRLISMLVLALSIVFVLPVAAQKQPSRKELQKKLTGIWQMTQESKDGKLIYVPTYKLYLGDGTYKFVSQRSLGEKGYIAHAGRWSVSKEGRLVEDTDYRIDQKKGEKSALEFELTDADHLAITWHNKIGMPIIEYYVRITKLH